MTTQPTPRWVSAHEWLQRVEAAEAETEARLTVPEGRPDPYPHNERRPR